MAWGRKKQALEVEVASQAAVASEVVKNAAWIRTVPEEEIKELFDDYLKRGEAIIKKASLVWFVRKASIIVITDFFSDLNQVETAWNEIDVHAVTDQEAQVMFSALHTIPGILSLFKVRAATYDVHDAYNNGKSGYVSYSRSKLRERELYQNYFGLDVYEVKERNAQAKTNEQSVKSQITNLANSLIEVMQAQKGRSPGDLPKAKGSFRASSYSKDKDLYAKLTKLEKLWKQASQISHSVEDRYFLEETVKTYVPDALKLYAGFIHVPSAAKQDARNMLFQQLGLIEKELRRLASASVSTNLQQMQAQVDFLKMKVED